MQHRATLPRARTATTQACVEPASPDQPRPAAMQPGCELRFKMHRSEPTLYHAAACQCAPVSYTTEGSFPLDSLRTDPATACLNPCDQNHACI